MEPSSNNPSRKVVRRDPCVVYITANHVYHIRYGICVQVRSVETSKILVGHELQNRKLSGFKRSDVGPLAPEQRPGPGDILVFEGERDGQQVETTPITHIRPATDSERATYPKN